MDKKISTFPQRRSAWSATLLASGALLVFVFLVIGIDQGFHPQLDGLGLVAAGSVMALVPALTWLAIFYWQDHLNPEPLVEVGRTFVIGLALAGALSLPLVEHLFGLRQWLYRDNLSLLAGAVCLLGGVQAFTIYAAVRYFIFYSPEFDERIDGVVYGAAAGLGMACAWNLDFILSSGEAALSSGIVYISEAALAQAAFGSLLGYFLGRAKMERDPVWWLPLGIALTALLEGAFFIFSRQVGSGQASLGAGSNIPNVSRLLLAGALVLGIISLVFYLVRRDIQRTLAGNILLPDSNRQEGDRRANFWVIGVVAIMLLAAAAARSAALNRQLTYYSDGLRLSYPASFRQLPASGCILRLADPAHGTAEVSVCLKPRQGEETLEQAAARLEAASAADYELYSMLDQRQASLDSQPALRRSFAWVQASQPGQPPRLRLGEQALALYQGQVLSITLLASEADLPAARLEFEKLLIHITGLKP